MVTKLQKWGNSQGIRLPKDLLAEIQLGVGDEVQVSLEKGRIIVEPVTRVRGKYTLKALVSRMPQDYQRAELDWDGPVGKEAW